MTHLLTLLIVLYFIIGLSITAFCVHMSYHEAAVGFGDNDDLKAQKVLESKIGPVGFIFLFTFWPIALLIAFLGKSQQNAEPADTTLAAQNTAVPVATSEKSQH